jgi:hypothetical protein
MHKLLLKMENCESCRKDYQSNGDKIRSCFAKMELMNQKDNTAVKANNLSQPSFANFQG